MSPCHEQRHRSGIGGNFQIRENLVKSVDTGWCPCDWFAGHSDTSAPQSSRASPMQDRRFRRLSRKPRNYSRVKPILRGDLITIDLSILDVTPHLHDLEPTEECIMYWMPCHQSHCRSALEILCSDVPTTSTKRACRRDQPLFPPCPYRLGGGNPVLGSACLNHAVVAG